MKCLLDIFVYQLQDRSSKAVFLRMHCAHLVYKLTKKKKIYLVHTITRLSTQSSIVSTKRKRTIPGAKKKKKKTESRFEIRDVVSYQRRTFSRGILFDPRVRKKKDQHVTSTRGGTNSLRGQNAARITFLLLIFLVLPPLFPLARPSSSSSSTLLVTRRKSWRGSRSNCFRDSREYISRAISRGLRPRFGYFIGVFRIDLVGGR